MSVAAGSFPRIAVVAAGAMGSAVANRLHRAGCTVLTNLDGRSDATRRRALDAGMIDVSLGEMVQKAQWILSILPPRDAHTFAEMVGREASKTGRGIHAANESLVFVDCNAVSPETAKRIAGVFAATDIKFVDAGIIGGPPRDGYDPTFYASADARDLGILDAFSGLSRYGLKVSPLNGEGAGVGDASALKMSYAGITKGVTGLFTTMVLAAHASSPATADALLRELNISQSALLNRLVKSVPPMVPKAYRWVGEMEEIGDFVGGSQGDVYRGLARVYERVESSVEGDQKDINVLTKFVKDAESTLQRDK
ncbi:6-phosphogluconate dehydrogenase C-terminal domain-like protein [Hygrophoropsis aurantiaca]|uniref:6-phosphogluconate dehydrogenase C-terminal domain-like protein n=1 Tax=Hygrophoropsis aurantiaca TaxID=72124 RepID=A0ACB8AFC4_9AGAM|nr:6-phosphogluconate dehydrogenase C-terminal domain-like protein [Hygrophoropsis aurantiaca]